MFFGRQLGWQGKAAPFDLGFVPGPQDLVDKGLVAFALGAEIVEQVAVEP